MEFMSRGRRLFQYGDLEGDTRVSSANLGGGSSSDDIETERSGIVSANKRVRSSRRCLWIGSLVAVIIAIIIIAAAVQNRQHLKAAAEALMQSMEDADVMNIHGGAVVEDVTSETGRSANGKQPYTFNDYVSLTYYPEAFNGTWISDTEVLFRDQYGGLSITNVASASTRTVVSHNQILDLHPVDFEFSADRSYLLIKTSSQRVWRRSSFGSYALVKIGEDGRPAAGPPVPLLPTGVEAGGDDLRQYLRYVSWAPVGNALAYVDYENNLHYRPAAEAANIQLTSSGAESVVYNGIPDWVNEEEVFEDNKALYWSPDAEHLVYGVFNDTEVEIVRLPRYGNWREDTLNRQGYPFLQYFLFDDFHYPKAGAVNPMVTLWCAEVGPPGPSADRPVRQYILPPPRSLADTEHHFTLVTWASNTTVAVNWMNRVQNLTAINLCEVAGSGGDDGTSDSSSTSPQCNEVFVLEQRDGWVDYLFKVVFNKYKFTKRFLTIMPAAAMRHRYRQLFLIDLENNNRTLLTRSEAEVTEILAWTQDDQVYYLATSPNDPGARHLYRLDLVRPEPTCLTCLHHAVAGVETMAGGEAKPILPDRAACNFVSVTMSKEGSYYSMDCKGPDVPYSCIHQTATNALVSVWTDNRFMAARYGFLDAPTVRYLSVPVPGSDQEAQVVVFLPSAAASAATTRKKFPLLVDVYGGPGFQVCKYFQYYLF